MGNTSGRWRVWIDTGGTFTDCLGVDPTGRLHRLKVLSSSSLRGRVASRVDGRTLSIEEEWLPRDLRDDAAGAELLAGCRFRLLEGSNGKTPVAGFDPVAGHLRLEADPGPAAGPGAVFELLSPDEAPVLAARLLTRTPQDRPLPPLDLRLATTRGTNALLERTGARTAFFVTRGFGDLLVIGDQSRPDLFAVAVETPEPLYAAVVEVPERLAADGSVMERLVLDGDLDGDLESPSDGALASRVDELVASGIESAAVALLHAYRDPAHERALGSFLAERGFRHVALSAELAPLIRIVPRAETAVVEAYLAPIIDGYLARVREALPARGASVQVMTSAGGLVGADRYRAKDSLLSGPAGGVVGAAEAGRRSGFRRVIGFDMGGTSTDVARHDRGFEYLFEHRVGDARLLAPALAIETVAAGGGSICRFEAGRLLVGPESAGADPGPACYGAGGPLTLTDVNLLLGRLDPARFGIPVDRRAARERLDELVRAVAGAGGEPPEPEGLLAGCLEIADERMSDAVRRISLRRGYDPSDYTLVAFGGAGGQHAGSLAEHLGMDTALVPVDAGLLSALGLGSAVVERFAQRQVLEPLDQVEGGGMGDDVATRADRQAPGSGGEGSLQGSLGTLGNLLEELAREAVRAVVEEGIAPAEVEVRRRIVHLRLEGQETAVPVELGPTSAPGGAGDREPAGSLAAAFEAAYRELYGYAPPRRRIEVESVQVVASSRSRGHPAPEPVAPGRTPEPAGMQRAWFGTWRDVPVFEREGLSPGDRLNGPALVFERHAATVVLPGWHATLDAAHGLVLQRSVL